MTEYLDPIEVDGTPRQCVNCGQKLRVGPNGAKGDTTYTCWSNPIAYGPHVPDVAMPAPPPALVVVPTKDTGSPSAWVDEAQELVEHPGEWMCVLAADDQVSRAWVDRLAYKIRTATLAAFRPAGAFQAEVRDRSVWARCVAESVADVAA